MMNIIIGLVLAYLLGSIPTGLWIGKFFFKKNLREYGSGNTGTTNTFRVLGKTAGTATFIIDFLKGTFATLLPFLLHINGISPMIFGLLAVLGHTFPIFARFKGGKAVATGSGVFIFLYPALSALLLVIFFSTLFITGYVSLGSILICLTSIVYLAIFETGVDKWVMIVMCIFVIYMHKKNIQRLLNGTENQSKAKLRLGRKK